jgi:hypothetical protein
MVNKCNQISDFFACSKKRYTLLLFPYLLLRGLSAQLLTALNVQESDTTGDAESAGAGSKKRFVGDGMV